MTATVLLFLICMVSTTVTAQSWQQHGSISYYVSTDSVSGFSAAEIACSNFGPNVTLVLIKTSDVQDFINSILTSYSLSGDYFIGLKRLESSTTGKCFDFEWIDGTTFDCEVDFTNWADLEPNNNEGDNDCGVMKGGGKWYSELCNLEIKYICQTPGIPSTSSPTVTSTTTISMTSKSTTPTTVSSTSPSSGSAEKTTRDTSTTTTSSSLKSTTPTTVGSTSASSASDEKTTTDGSGGGSSSDSTTIIIAVVVSVVVIILILVAVLVVIRKKRNSQRKKSRSSNLPLNYQESSKHQKSGGESTEPRKYEEIGDVLKLRHQKSKTDIYPTTAENQTVDTFAPYATAEEVQENGNKPTYAAIDQPHTYEKIHIKASNPMEDEKTNGDKPLYAEADKPHTYEKIHVASNHVKDNTKPTIKPLYTAVNKPHQTENEPTTKPFHAAVNKPHQTENEATSKPLYTAVNKPNEAENDVSAYSSLSTETIPEETKGTAASEEDASHHYSKLESKEAAPTSTDVYNTLQFKH